MPPEAMALFSWVMIAIFAGFVLGILALGLYSPRTGADVLDWKPTRSPELEAQNEVDDVAQMLEAANAARRRRGLAERTEDDVAGALDADRRELDRRAREYRPGPPGPAGPRRPDSPAGPPSRRTDSPPEA